MKQWNSSEKLRTKLVYNAPQNKQWGSQMFFKIRFLKMLQISQENTCVGVSF